jgi:hypothetical protein
MSRMSKQGDCLIQIPELNSQPALVVSAHVRANHAAGNFAPVRMRPPDTARANVRASPNEAVSSEPVQIKLQSVL